MEPDLAASLAADIATLRARNGDEASCFPFTHDDGGLRLITAGEVFPLTAPGSGQTIAVCALDPDDLDAARSPFRTAALREAGSDAHSGVVFVRTFGDRVDLVPAGNTLHQLSCFVQPLFALVLADALECGMRLKTPVSGDDLHAARLDILKREAAYLPKGGHAGAWLEDYALPRAAHMMSRHRRGPDDFGFGRHPNAPRDENRLPAAIRSAVEGDADLARRSIGLEVALSSEDTRQAVRNGRLLRLLLDTFGSDGDDGITPSIVGHVSHHHVASDDIQPLVPADALAQGLAAATAVIARHAEEYEEDLADAITSADLKIVLLIDFRREPPWDLCLAKKGSLLGRELQEEILLHMIGRGECLAYESEDPDDRGHPLYRVNKLG